MAGDDPGRRDPAALPPCDLVLRGGITSGVIYPGTVARLARSYRFVNVGGASAGAIAAAVTAAAELGNQRGNRQAFAQVESLARGLGGGPGGTTLRRLFTADPKVATLDRLLWLALESWPWRTRLLAAIAGIAAFLALIAPFVLAFQPAGITGPLFLGLYVLLLVMVTVAARTLWTQVMDRLPEAGFGLSPGAQPDLPQTLDAHAEQGALSDWLHATIQRVAGRGVGWAAGGDDRQGKKPVTVGCLAAAPVQPVKLVLTTTNLSQQLPHHFPALEREPGEFYFRQEELRRVLPLDVVAWMVEASPGRLPNGIEPDEPGTYHALPAPDDLPILLGVRLSLSFPGLIAAVPLWAVDHGRAGTPLPVKRLRRCWFSDGGITSNFPINVFDAPLPTRPTFCVNLSEAAPDQEDLVWLPPANGHPHPPRFPSGRIASIADFVGAISTTARNAHENELMMMPGYRERIVEVATASGEGGLNLAMSAEVIAELSARGAVAAEQLVARFHGLNGDDPSRGWDDQRWLRFRSTMDALERYLGELERTWTAPSLQATPFADVEQSWSPGSGTWRPSHYAWADDATAEAARTCMDAALAAAKEMARVRDDLQPAGTAVFDRDTGAGGAAPRPRLALQMRPWRGAPATRPPTTTA